MKHHGQPIMRTRYSYDFPRLLLSSAFFLVTLTGQSSADGFFDGPIATSGDPMFFSIYSVLKEQKGNFNLQKISDGGFTTAGPHYHANNGGDPIGNAPLFYSRVADAAEVDLGIIAHITWHPDVVNNTSGDIRPNSMAAIPEVDVRAHVRQVMDFTLNDAQANATTHKWYTMPEELRSWKAAEMNYLSIVADEVKSYDPLGRPVSMYNPNHRSSNQLNTIVGQGLDETLMGVYVTTVPFATRGARIADGVNRILASASSTSTTPVMGAQLSTDFDSSDIAGLRTALGGVSESEAIKHVIRHDVYQGLLRGIEGVHIWSGHDNRAGLTTFSEQLDGYMSVSEDMNLDLNLSDVFLQGDKRTDFQATVLTGPNTVTHDSTTIATITLSDMAYGDSRYLFLANSSNSPLSISVDGLPAGVQDSQLSDLFGNAPELVLNSATGNMLLNMEPLEVVALQITPAELIPGDYSGDGFVDATDYAVWLQNLGGASLPNNETESIGVVDQADYLAWRNNFGAMSSSSAGTTLDNSLVVPEPSSGAIVGVLLILSCYAGCGGLRSVIRSDTAHGFGWFHTTCYTCASGSIRFLSVFTG